MAKSDILEAAKQFIQNLRAARSQIETIPHGSQPHCLKGAYLTDSFRHNEMPTHAMTHFITQAVQADQYYKSHEVSQYISYIFKTTLTKFNSRSGNDLYPLPAVVQAGSRGRSRPPEIAAETYYEKSRQNYHNMYIDEYGEYMWQYIAVLEAVIDELKAREI